MRTALLIIMLSLGQQAKGVPAHLRTPMGFRVVVMNPYCHWWSCGVKRVITSPAWVLRLFFDKYGQVNW